MTTLRLVLIIIIAFSASSAWAKPPIPKNKSKEVGSLEHQLIEEKNREDTLKDQIKKIEAEIQDTKKRLVDLAGTIRRNEKDLLELEARITSLEVEKVNIHNSLEKERESIADLVTALERIRRLPPEALIVKPDAPLKTAQSVMLMKDIIPVLYQKAETLKINLEKLNEVSRELGEKRHIAFKKQENLKKEHAALSALTGKKEKLYKTTKQNFDEQRKTVSRISSQAKNLQDLVRRLDAQKKKEEKAALAASASRPKPSKSIAKPPKLGQAAQMPISGIIKVKYNEPDIFGAPSKGLTIEGRGGALITAPLSGTVQFAGFFKNYGNLIILEHEGGYHSLIAGLEKIDTEVGHKVSAGEPIGLLHHANSGQKPALYYELRHNGKTINPAKIFTDLG